MRALVVRALIMGASVVVLSGAGLGCAAKKKPPLSPPPTPSVVAPTPIVAPAPTPSPAPPTREERQRAALAALFGSIDTGEPEVHASLYASEAIKAFPFAEGWREIRGREAIAKHVRAMRAGRKDNKTVPVRFFHKGDVVVVEWISVGTHVPSNKPVSLRGASVVWFDEAAQIKRENVYVDLGATLMQTGRLPGRARGVALSGGEPSVVIRKESAGEPLVAAYRAGWPTAWPKKDVALYTSGLTEDFVREPIASPVDVRGKQQATLEMQTLLQNVTNLSVAVENAWEVGSFVLAETVLKATQRGMLSVLTGSRRITVHGLDVAEYQGDKLARLTTYSNSLELLVQLGLVPTSLAAEPKADPAPAPSPSRSPSKGQGLNAR